MHEHGRRALRAGRLPLPVLLYVVAKPEADICMDAVLLSELVRLGERVCRPM